MESPSKASRSQVPSAWPPLLLMLLAGLCFGSSFARLVGPLSPGGVLVDVQADPRTETTYQDCSSAAPLASVPAAARPLTLRWVRVRYRGVLPSPDLEAASRWIGERLPVSGVEWTVEDLDFTGPEGLSIEGAMYWTMATLRERDPLDLDVHYIAVMPRLQWSGGTLGLAQVYGQACAVLDVDGWLGRLSGHELGHCLGVGPHAAYLGGCPPLMSTVGQDACLEIGGIDWLTIWGRLYVPEARLARGYERGLVACRFGGSL